MAKVYEQEVPPSMIETYTNTIRLGLTTQGYHTLAAVNQKATSARPEKSQTPLAKFASTAATWLTNRWLWNADRGSRSSFYKARRAEIIASNFDAEFWAAGVMFYDRSELAIPAVYPYTGKWNPAYWDELRQPSRCEYRDISAVYDTPADEGTEEHPAPGWKGTVIDSRWRDLYHVQRRVTFELQHSILPDDGRPVAVALDWTIAATATIRGNKNWFTIIVSPTFHLAGFQFSPAKAACTHWARADQYTPTVPGDSPGGWDYSIDRTEIRDARRYALLGSDQPCNWLTLRIATPPSLGFYGSRNDAVTVRNYGTAAVYTAK